MDLVGLEDFILVARNGGFGRAARAGARPKATLSRRVAELESSLNVRLFERGARTLKLTEEGRALYERAGLLVAELEQTAAAIASGGQTPKGRLRISAPLLFSQTAMGKLAAGFVRRFPEVKLEITTEDRAVDMIEEAYDLVIRVNPEPDVNLIGRIFLHDRLVVVASPDFPVPAGDEVVPAVVRGAVSPAGSWEVQTTSGRRNIAVSPVLGMSSFIMVRDAVRLGTGPARLPLSLVSQDLADGRLVLWGSVDGPDTALWALYPSRRLLSARVSAFLQYLKEVFPGGTPEELAAYTRD